MTTITATYSPEDNKLRLYPASRLDADTYERVKSAGFKWAPKQELFVAPKWTPQREDLALELAGEIEPEEMTVAERAAAKAERLDELANKRQRDANRFARAADELSKNFEFGQPILVGHHSERRARKAQEKMHNAMDRATKATATANFWLYRAAGVEYHANRKNNPKVRAGRIKTLLAELRDVQGSLNHMHMRLAFWERVTTDDMIRAAVGQGQIATGPLTEFGEYMAMERGEKTPQEIRQASIDRSVKALESGHWQRWIAHILNRLAFERDQLGDVVRHEGELRETVIQMFAREQGAHKPTATKTDLGYSLESSVPLPAHIADGLTMELTVSEWRDLMRDCGYSVPDVKRNAKPPLLNLDVAAVVTVRFGEKTIRQTVHMTKAEYKHATRFSEPWVETSACRGFRIRCVADPNFSGPRYQAPMCAVFMTDSKAHDIPESDSIKHEAAE